MEEDIFPNGQYLTLCRNLVALISLVASAEVDNLLDPVGQLIIHSSLPI